MKHVILFCLIISLAMVAIFSCQDANTVLSPDRNIALSFVLDEQGRPCYSVHFKQKPIISSAGLGLETGDGFLDRDFEIRARLESTVNESYRMPAGKTRKVVNHYNELTVKLGQTSGQKRQLNLIFRVFNDGVAIRYQLPETDAPASFVIKSEQTEFRFAPGS